MEVRNILVPIDFSTCSKNALRVAVMLAKKWNAHIHLVNAISLPMAHAEMGSYMTVDPLIHDQEAEAKQLFSKLDEEIPELNDVNYHVRQYVAQVTQAIFSEMDIKKIDIVVMGTKGSHDIIERLLGSITSEIISASEVPVLMIPENIEALQLKRIGFAADFKSIKVNKTISLVKTMAEAFEAPVVVFHVLSKDHKPLSRIPAEGKLRNLFASVGVSFEIATYDEVSQGIVQFVDEHSLDMLVMLPRQHDFFDKLLKRSVTRAVAMKLKVPLLAIHQ